MNPTQQILAALGGLVVLVLGAAGPALVALFQYFTAKAKAAKADLEDAQAKRSVMLAEEARASKGLDSAATKAIALADFKARVPGADDAKAESAIQSAVGQLPGIGASGRPDAPMFPADAAVKS